MKYNLSSFFRDKIDGLFVGTSIFFAIFPLLIYGYPSTHDHSAHLRWIFQFDLQFLAGQFYPRWLEQSFASLGAPVFTFYSPLSAIATLPFAAFNLAPTQRLIGSMVLATLVLSVGTYICAKLLFRDGKCVWLPGVVSAMMVLSPYFLIDIYLRGACAEVWAIAYLPWILFGILLNLRAETFWRKLFLAVAYALLALSHLPTLLIFTFAWVFVPILALHNISSIWSFFKRFLLPISTGMAIASIHLFPAILDQKYANIDAAKWTTASKRLIVFGLSRFNPRLATHRFDVTLFPVFLIAFLIVLIAIPLCFRFRLNLEQNTQFMTISLLGCTILSVLLMTDLGRPFYYIFPILEKIQFSWRWMAISSVSSSFLWGTILQFLIGINMKKRSRLFMLSGFLAMSFVAILYLDYGIIGRTTFNSEKINIYDLYLESRPRFPQEVDVTERPVENFTAHTFVTAEDRLIFADVPQFSLKSAVDINDPDFIRPSKRFDVWPFSKRNYDLLEWEEGSGTIEVENWRYGQRDFVVESPAGGSVSLRTYAWPGWQIQLAEYGVNSMSRIDMDSTSDGRIQIQIPPGQFQVSVTYRGTIAERFGTTVSCVIILISLTLLGRSLLMTSKAKQP